MNNRDGTIQQVPSQDEVHDAAQESAVSASSPDTALAHRCTRLVGNFALCKTPLIAPIFLDTETTGFNPADGDRIVEIAIMDGPGNVLLDTLVNPERPIPSDASNIHGIRDEHVVNAPTLEDLRPRIIQIIAGKRVVIFNLPFDMGFLPFIEEHAAEVYCAMEGAKEAMRMHKWPKLAQAAEWANHRWGDDNPHRALADTKALRSVYKAILLDMVIEDMGP